MVGGNLEPVSLGDSHLGSLATGERPTESLGVQLIGGGHRPTLSDAISRCVRYAGSVVEDCLDRGGGIARNGQKSTLNASLLHTSCNSRAICPSQRDIRVTHNPWVVGSNATPPAQHGCDKVKCRALALPLGVFTPSPCGNR